MTDSLPEVAFTLPEVANNLRWLRRLREMTLKEVSSATGLSISFLSDIERGRTSPSIETLEKLATAYNTPLCLRLGWQTEED